MLGITKKTGYGLVALAHLAKSPGKLISARALAEEFAAPTALLMNILKELAAAGYVESVRGAHGGYRLVRPPEQVTLADVIWALEGPLRRSDCLRPEALKEDPASCRHARECPTDDPIHVVHRRLRRLLEAITLADIMDPEEKHTGPVGPPGPAPPHEASIHETARLP